MPRVLRIINRLNLGGPTYNAAYLTALLQPEFETLLLAGVKESTEQSSIGIVQSMGIEPRVISSMHRSIGVADDWDSYREIRKIIKEFKPDIVHSHAAKAGALGRIAASREKVPVILHTFHGHVFQGYFNPLTTRMFIGLERYLASLSSGIIAISALQKKELTETYRICPAEKTTIIPLGFDLGRFNENQENLRNEFRSEYGLDDSTIAVGIIGRLVNIKNHKLFISTWARILVSTKIPVHAFIIGDGELREELENACSAQGIAFNTPGNRKPEAKLTFTSWIIDIERALAGLDLITLTSFNEGTPVSLIEAQSAGKPVIATDVGGVSDTMIDGQTGILVPSGGHEELKSAMLKLIEDSELRNQMGCNGRSFTEPRFGVTQLISNMRTYYHRLLESV